MRALARALGRRALIAGALVQYPDESFTVSITRFSYAANDVEDYTMKVVEAARRTTCTILDDGDAGTFGFQPLAYELAEADAPVWVNLTITRTNRNHPSGVITVFYSTIGRTAQSGVDFTAVANQGVTFSDGQHVRFIEIRILPDDEFEVRGELSARVRQRRALSRRMRSTPTRRSTCK